MKKWIILACLVAVLSIFSLPAIPRTGAQTPAEKEFVKEHQEEMTSFMTKCSACHSLQRIFAKKRSPEEWDQILKQMTGKPHAAISEKEMAKIKMWIEFMQSALIVGP
jgi:hypothetical protein